MKKTVFVLLSYCVLSFYQGWSQYSIKINLNGLPDKMLYLVGNYGNEFIVFDSAEVKGHKTVVFENKKKKLPSGIYQIVNQQGNSYLYWLIEKSRHFIISGTSYRNPYGNTTVTNSEDHFMRYCNLMARKDSLSEEYIDDMLDMMGSSILKLYHNATTKSLDVPDFSSETPEKALRLEYQYLMRHYFDFVDFSDPNILRIPIDYHVDDFFNEIILQHPDTLLKELAWFIDTKLTNEEVKKYFIPYLVRLFADGDAIHDIALVYLFDRFCINNPTEYLEEYDYQRINRIVKRIKKLLPGAKVPALQAYNIQNQLVSSDTISHKYIILWFWDPDCEDCMVETPELHRLYNIYKDIFDFEVYAVSVTEDYERWDSFIKEHNLSWINVSYAMGIPNYDFVQYFDILTTPGIYLINREHIIIARQFTLDTLHIYFE